MIARSNNIPLTWHMLTHRKGRLLLAVLGIAFAVLLMFMQLGFLTGLFDSQTLAIRLFDAELLIVNRTRHNVTTEESFVKSRLIQARDVPGVASTTGIYADNSIWRNSDSGRQDVIRVIGIDPADPPFKIDEVRQQSAKLEKPMSVLFDSGSRSFFGSPKTGTLAELNGQSVEVIGNFPLGADFKNDGNAIVSYNTYLRLFPMQSEREMAIGLVRLQPGANPESVRRAITQALPDDILVYTIDGYDRIERRFWSKMTPIGTIFSLGLFVGFVIGVLICYQILFNEINDHLPQFATMKAIGFTDRYLVGVVLREAVLLSVLGLIPALVASQAFYSIMIRLSGLHMELTPIRILLVSGLTMVMCIISGLIAVGRVIKADPAEVF
jgi:putative ABC transport system permease protein